MKPRRQGVVATMPDTTPVGLQVEAKKILAEREARLRADRARRSAIPVPNRICYATTAFLKWKPGDRIPKCRVCEGLLHPNDNHVCPGFTPKFVDHDEAWHQNQDSKRAEIKESNRNRPKKCSGCHEIIRDEDDARYHDEYCEIVPGGRRWYTDDDPIVGDNDGHECYEDYVEPDYCEGSDDGYDCD
jgi:hypothetical protein